MSKQIGDIIDEMVSIRDARKEIANEDKELKAQYDELSEELIGKLRASGTDQARSDSATASLKVDRVASVADPGRFTNWLLRTKNLQLLQMRVSNPAYRELMQDRRQEIPGLSGYDKETITLRARR